MFKNLSNLMQFADAAKKGFKQVKEEFKCVEINGFSSNSKVQIKINCLGDVKDVKIDSTENLLNSDLEILIKEAMLDARDKIKSKKKEIISSNLSDIPMADKLADFL